MHSLGDWVQDSTIDKSTGTDSFGTLLLHKTLAFVSLADRVHRGDTPCHLHWGSTLGSSLEHPGALEDTKKAPAMDRVIKVPNVKYYIECIRLIVLD